MKVHYPKLYNMAHLLALNVLLLPKDLTIIFICIDYSVGRWCKITVVIFWLHVAKSIVSLKRLK